MLRSSLSNLDREIKKSLSSYFFDEEELNSLSNQVSANPTLLKGEELNLFRTLRNHGISKEEKLMLGLISWYLPREIGSLLLLRLEEIWGNEFLEIKETLLHSKDFALGTILEQNWMNDNDFFGNYLKEKFLKHLFKKFFVRKESKILKAQRGFARSLVRRRGHRDGGHRRISSFDKNRKKEIIPISVEEYEQEKLEQERKILQFYVQVNDRLRSEFSVSEIVS